MEETWATTLPPKISESYFSLPLHYSKISPKNCREKKTLANPGELRWKNRSLFGQAGNTWKARGENNSYFVFPDPRILLAAINPYFRAMFSNSFRECQDGEVLLQDMDPPIIQAVVQYFYTEEIVLTPEIAEDLYEAASRLQILPLLESCSR